MMTEAERIELPLFPLHTVLFPGGRLPLKIFEQRYVEMTKRCVRDSSGFGVCLIREGREVGEPAVPAEVGCIAVIEEWDLPHPGIFHLLVRGERRFRVLQSRVEALGLIVCEAQVLPPDAPDGVPDALCRNIIANLIERVGAEGFPGPVALDDPAWVGYRLAEVLPLDLEIRQRLMEMDDPALRLAALHDILVASGLGQQG
jgi:Lon protease-like protein